MIHECGGKLEKCCAATLADYGIAMESRFGTFSARWFFAVAVTALAYYAFGRFAVYLAIPPGVATAVWPPSGIALAAVLLAGYRVWPGIWLGSFLVNIGTLWHSPNATAVVAILVTANIGLGSTLQALVGGYFIQRITGSSVPLSRSQDVFKFIGVEILSCLLAPTFGATGLCLGGFLAWSSFAFSWWTWWIGDLIGVLVIAPVLLSWWSRQPISWKARDVAEAAVLLLTLLVLSQIVFGVPSTSLRLTEISVAFLLTPPVIWAAFRFGLRGVTLTIVLISVAVLWGTILGRGPFVRDSVAESLLLMQIFIGVVVMIGLVLAASQSERQSAEAALRVSTEKLELRVQERTAELEAANSALQSEVADRRRTEQSLRNSEMRFRLLVEGVEDHAIFMLDPQGRVASWNAGAERIQGYRAEEIIGRHFSCFYPTDAIQQSGPEKELANAIANDRCEDEGWRVRKDGDCFWANVLITALKDEQGNLKGFSKIVHDLTERKLAEEKFRSLLESAPDAMVIVDEHDIIRLVNAQAERLFGYTRAELLGQAIELLVPEIVCHKHQRDRADDSANLHNRPMDAGLELSGRRKDGTQFPVEISLSPLETKEGVLISSAIRDITARKQIQEALRKSERLAAIGETVTGLAHESRNALQRSQSCLEMLAREVDSRPKALDLVARIQSAQDDLHHLFEAVRKYAAPIVLDARSCHLGLVVQECWDNLSYLWQRKQVTLRSEMGNVDLRCWADPVAMGQVLRNILENSLQACGGCAEIDVEWSDAQVNDRPALRIVLRDNGPGLGQEQRAKIFDPFYSTKTRGFGLGMALAKRIVEAHQGRIAVGACERPGTEIHITLPRSSG